MVVNRVVEFRLRGGSILRIYPGGIESDWFVGDNDFHLALVEWSQITLIRRIREGNPFQPPKEGWEAHETGLLFVSSTGMTLMLMADEKGHAEAVGAIRGFMGSRWSSIFDDREIAAVHGGFELTAPQTLRRPFVIMTDPQRVLPGRIVSQETAQMKTDRGRPILKRALMALAFGWLATANAVLAFLWTGSSSSESGLAVASALFLMGAACLAVFAVNVVRWKRLEPIVLYENGVFVPRKFMSTRDEFLPFEFVNRVEYGYKRGHGKVVLLKSLPWLRPLEVSSTMPKLKEVLISHAKGLWPGA